MKTKSNNEMESIITKCNGQDEDKRIICKDLAFKCANALVEAHNNRDGGSVRLFSFRQLYKDLQELGHARLITNALRPDDYPKEMWFV